jgi:hypothetical protein
MSPRRQRDVYTENVTPAAAEHTPRIRVVYAVIALLAVKAILLAIIKSRSQITDAEIADSPELSALRCGAVGGDHLDGGDLELAQPQVFAENVHTTRWPARRRTARRRAG